MSKLYIAFAVALVATMPAMAQDRGIYVGISGGYARVDIDKGDIDAAARSAGFATSSTSADESDAAWKLFAGYQYNRNFALEFGYADLGEATTRTRTTGPVSTINGEFKADAWSLDAVGTLPLNDRFSLFGRLGAAYYDLDARAAGLVGAVPVSVRESDKGFTWKAGLGAQYNFSKNLAARLEWERYDEIGDNDTGKSDVNVLSLGLRLSF